MARRGACSRREFLKRSAAAVTAPYVLTSAALGAAGRPAASDRIVMGAIGVGGRGTGNMKAFLGSPEVQVVAVCDVFEDRRRRAKATVDQAYGSADCAAYNDFRDLVTRSDLDAVCIGTPDHWHAIPTIWACREGKDVYCEKPLSLTVREGRAMVEAARRYGRVVSGGSQRVLEDYGRQAEAVRSGAAGRITEVYVEVGGPSRPCPLGAEPVPPGLDWDLWLGPAPWAPYHRERCSAAYGGGSGFRAWRDYSGGMMTDWGGHKFAAALFALGLEETGPVEIIPPDGRENKLLTYVFSNGVRMYHAPGTKYNVTFIGTEGQVPGVQPARAVPMPRYKGRGGIYGDFLYCVRTRERPFRDVEISHRAATVCHLGNIAYWLGRRLRWNPDTEQIVGDEEAGRWLDRPKREPWRL